MPYDAPRVVSLEADLALGACTPGQYRVIAVAVPSGAMGSEVATALPINALFAIGAHDELAFTVEPSSATLAAAAAADGAVLATAATYTRGGVHTGRISSARRQARTFFACAAREERASLSPSTVPPFQDLSSSPLLSSPLLSSPLLSRPSGGAPREPPAARRCAAVRRA